MKKRDAEQSPSRWVVRSSDGLYWDLGYGGDIWVEEQYAACKFTQRSRAVDVAARTMATVVRLVQRGEGS